ncbi:MAG: UDP-N-acetylenolpyruvoylglucosamine reductase [Actinobacteria bacterium RBG_16_68_21]|nr:MAG: UDP-N-acetylenolpyruvoylglucosamine reductase [Actinobacteria bacterium RBG_16_68_21]
MSAYDELLARGRLDENVPLAGYTTYRFGGPARYMVVAEDGDDVAAAGSLARDEGLPLLALGRGSNLVIADEGFPGVVIRAGAGLSRLELVADGVVVAGAGHPLPLLARQTVRAGRGGLEFYAGIPGSVGGAIRMNAGCHGSETSEWLITARVIDLAGGGDGERTPEELGLSYRHSDLGDDDFVVEARFGTVDIVPSDGEETIREISRWRREHQPGGTLNAGSVFKNPPGDHAGRLIDAAGLKGMRIGGAEVSERHANFFLAHPGATARDVYLLVAEVRRRVLASSGVDLTPEIRFAGEFE